jgi:hypothetical protein
MIIAKPIDTMIVEQSMATPVQGSPAWRRMMTGRKMNRTNSHKARVERRASVQRAWLFNDGMKCATPPGDGARSCRKTVRLSRGIMFKARSLA